METDHICEYLDWDSRFFGCEIARATVNRLTPQTVKTILTWCNSRRIDCLYFLGDSDDTNTTRLAEDNGFRLVDIRITLEKQLGGVLSTAEPQYDQGIIRSHTADDVPALCAIARTSHRDSRFYHDPNLPTSLCDALYETWIAKSCNGYANAVLVAEFEERPVGYISCHLLDQARGQIGLVGVSPDVQGRGLGHGLVHESLRWFAGQGITQVTVVTQGRNWKAQRLYQKNGFLTRSVQLWYHKWFTPEEIRVAR